MPSLTLISARLLETRIQSPLRTLSLALGGCCLITSLQVSAAQWYWNPALSTFGQYNDNLSLSTEPNDKEVYAIGIKPTLTFGVRQPNWQFESNAMLNSRRYDGDEEFGQTDASFGWNSSFRASEKTRYSLDGEFVHNTTLDSDFESSGLVFQRLRRQQLNINPGWSYSLNERTRIFASVGATDVDFLSDISGEDFSEYRMYNGSTGFQFIYSPKNTFTTTLGYLDYDATSLPSPTLPVIRSTQVQQSSLQLGWTRQIDPTLYSSLSLGGRHTTSKIQNRLGAFSFPQTESDGSGFTMAGSITKQFERTKLSASMSRDAVPSSVAGFLETDRLTLNMSRGITERLRGALLLSYYRSDTLDAQSNTIDRELFRISPSLNWQLSREWQLNTSYQYLEQRIENSSAEQSANSASIDIKYTWPQQAISR